MLMALWVDLVSNAFNKGTADMLYPTLLLGLYSVSIETSNTCDEVVDRCTEEIPCGMTLHNYRISCQRERYGLIRECSEFCLKSVIALATTPQGYDLWDCECGRDVYCHTVRNRTGWCWNPAGRTRMESIPVDCKSALSICRADSVCLEAYYYYKRLCRSMLEGEKCTRRCEYSISVLNRQTSGWRLKDCICSDDNCREERSKQTRLCVNTHNTGVSSRYCVRIILLMFELIVLSVFY
ncbi:growth arrest-specific protein 1-like [Centruroides sculpturatus]|uniref:growth arrest-specific protein 1-like n=1 Tax=Centruroides sculpturatus TaxID=218467 RepID=UPI000C6E848F|nr:growth arrest-specific protein 1-like [Centruroides sculpturatus]